MTSLAKLSSKIQGNALGISWLSHFGHEETLGRTGSKKKQPHLSAGTIDIAGTSSPRGRQQEAFTVCNITDGPMLCCICRLACPKTKLLLSLATACCPILCSILLSCEAIQRSQANPLAGHPPALCMALPWFPGTELVEIVVWKWGLKSRYVEIDLPAATCSCVYIRK